MNKYMVRVLLVIGLFVLAGCIATDSTEHLIVAESKIGLNEYQHRTVLKRYTGVDPRYTEWCAAFVNAVLEESNMISLHDMEHVAPLMARSFLRWGKPVDIPSAGDIVIFPRGDSDWKGHVGFYLNTVEKNNKVYYRILGGNQNDKVSIVLYPAKKALGIRRANKY